MQADEELQKLRRAVAKLQAELEREIAYTRKVNDKNMQLMEQIKELNRQLSDAIPQSELSVKKPNIYNERGAGRKRIASEELIAKVLALKAQNLSQVKIAAKLSDELNVKIGRTTVGEIVRGNYIPLDAL